MIKPEIVDRVRTETDIVGLVNGYVELKRSGRNYRARCPFHPDKDPSFYVSPERQTYHCFGCGAGGNAISFVMAMEKLDFPEAVKLLAEKLGIRITFEAAGRNQALYDACDNAAQFFETLLARSEKAKAYLKKRGIGNATAKRFRLGYVPGGNRLRGEVKRRAWPEQGFVKAGLLVKRDEGLSDYFRDRLMFPIFTMGGKVVGFGGRVLGDREPKYLNTAESPIFRKGNCLFGGFQAKGYIREQTPVLVEGNFDVVSLVEAGLNNVVAPLGTALTPDQAVLVRRYNHRVTVCFDSDDAGRKAARRALEVLLRAGLEPEVATIPGGGDPDDYVRAKGKAALEKVLAQPQDFVEYVGAGREKGSVLEQRAALRELAALTRVIPDQALRELYANRLSEKFRVSRQAVLRGTGGEAKERKSKPANPQLAERLVAMAVQDAGLAAIAKELGIPGCVSDGALAEIAGLATGMCEEPGYGPAMILDRVEDVDTKKRIAGWTFAEESLLTPAQYRVWASRFRAAWLDEKIRDAHARGKEREVETLTEERVRLLSEATRERSI